MAAVDLRFAHPPGSAHLVLGGDPAGSHPPLDAQLVGALPALRFEALAIPNASSTLVATFPALEMIAEARYASRAARPLVGSTGSVWQRGRGFEDGAEHRTASTASHPSQARASWQTGQSHDANVTTWRAATLVRAPVSATARFHGAIQQSPGALRVRIANRCTCERRARWPMRMPPAWTRWNVACAMRTDCEIVVSP